MWKQSFYFSKASAHPLPKVELPPNAIKAIKGSELEAASLPAQVGGTIVHVLGWKEGMAILPGSNLKVSHMSMFVWPCMCDLNDNKLSSSSSSKSSPTAQDSRPVPACRCDVTVLGTKSCSLISYNIFTT